MLYTGIINRCKMEDSVENELPKLKIWVTLNKAGTVVLETNGTFTELASKFGFRLLTDCLEVHDFIGRRCKVRYKEDVYSFVRYN